MRRVRTAFTAIAAAGLVAAGLGLAAPAQAADSWVYISLPTWLGNCPGGGSVKMVYLSVGDTWSTAGDAGDDIVYAKVHLNQSQPVTGEGLCYKGSQTYYGPAFYQDITPTRLKQTWWVGPGGTSHN